MVIVVMVRYIGSFRYHSRRYGESRRVVVLIPLTDPTYNRHDNYAEYKDEYQRKHYAEHPESKIKSESHFIYLSA